MSWSFRYALPSLTITEAFDSPNIIIAPFNDPRTQQALSPQSNTARLLSSFIDHGNRQIYPSVILTADNAPERAQSAEALIAFRNLCAISTLLKHWAHSTTDWRPSMLFSDHFDFYPFTVNDNNRIVGYTPDLSMGSSENAPFIGVSSPLLASFPGPIYCDSLFYKTLLRAWNKRFIYPGTNSKYTRILFRSLELAYQALSIPIKNQSSLHDFGVSVACWISAFEILVHLSHKEATKAIVLKELLPRDYPLLERKLTACRYQIKVGNKRPHVSIVQKTYDALYRARCDFLHGNEVSLKALFPYGYAKPSLNNLAPIIYRIALWNYMKPLYYRRDLIVNNFSWLRDYETYESSLLRIFQYPPAP